MLFRCYNVPLSSPYIICLIQCSAQAMQWTFCGIQPGFCSYTADFLILLFLFSLIPDVLKRISCSWICKLMGTDVRTHLLVTPSCLHAPPESPQLPLQHLTPFLAHLPSWKSTAPLRVSCACFDFYFAHLVNACASIGLSKLTCSKWLAFLYLISIVWLSKRF